MHNKALKSGEPYFAFQVCCECGVEESMVNYAYTIRDKVLENSLVMQQIANNTAEQAMLGDFSKAVDDAVIGSSEAHQNQMMQLLNDPNRMANFAKVIFELLKFSQ